MLLVSTTSIHSSCEQHEDMTLHHSWSGSRLLIIIFNLVPNVIREIVTSNFFLGGARKRGYVIGATFWTIKIY